MADLTATEQELVSEGRTGDGSTLLTRSQAARPFDRRKTSLPLNSGTTFSGVFLFKWKIGLAWANTRGSLNSPS